MNIKIYIPLLKNRFLSIILWIITLLPNVIAWAQPQVPDRPYPQKLVNDMAGLMSIEDRNRLEKELVVYNDSSSNQIAIVTIKSLGDYAIEDWALEIGRKWGVGSKSKNNGVVIIVSLEPRKINISPGYGLEGALPDVICKRIISNEMAPSFKNGQYYEGFSNAIKAIRSTVKGEYVNENPGDSGDGSWIFFVILIIIIIVFIIIANRKNRGAAYYGPNRKRHYDNGGGGGWIFWGGGGGFGGGGGGGSDDGGSFGGFGGGDFGGGGASGDW